MKKVWIIGTLAALALIVFGAVGYAYAQSQDSDSPNGTNGYGCGTFGAGSGQGSGGRMGRGMMGNRAADQGDTGCPMADGDENGTAEYGPLHNYMYTAFAQALGLTPEELETRRLAGDTMWDIAQEKGMTTEQFQEAITTARTSAVNQAVADGVITQEQGDFMLERMETMMGNGFGYGFGMGNGGCRGRGNNQP